MSFFEGNLASFEILFRKNLQNNSNLKQIIVKVTENSRKEDCDGI